MLSDRGMYFSYHTDLFTVSDDSRLIIRMQIFIGRFFKFGGNPDLLAQSFHNALGIKKIHGLAAALPPPFITGTAHHTAQHIRLVRQVFRAVEVNLAQFEQPQTFIAESLVRG